MTCSWTTSVAGRHTAIGSIQLLRSVRMPWHAQFCKGVLTMYIYDQGRTSSVPLGIGRLGDFGKSTKQTEPDPAQAIRLEEQIRTRHAKAKRLDQEAEEKGVPAPLGLWNGVNSDYEAWLQVRDETDKTKWPIHQMAAEAAMKRGDALSRYCRVVRALFLLKRAGGPAEERTALEKDRKDLEENWARVDIHLRRRLQSDIIYPVPPGGISRGDGRAAFKWASERLRERGKFNGLLPLAMWGRFSIDGQEISLEPDCALSLALVARLIQKRDGTFEKPECKPRPATAELNPPTLIDDCSRWI